MIWYMQLSTPIYVSVYMCAYTGTQAYFHKILLFNQFTTRKSVFWVLSWGWVCRTFLCPHPFKLSRRFEQGTWNSWIVQGSSEQLWSTIVFSSWAKRQLMGCLCLWYGNGNSQAVKSIMNKIEKFQGMEFVQSEKQKTSAYLFAEHPYERCRILKISWYSVMSRTIHPTPYFCTQEGKS